MLVVQNLVFNGTPALQALLFISISAIAMSYGWGMRGTTLGGEKGAMLPGAIMGLLIAIFSGSQILMDNFFVLAAVGAMSMFFGGCMTYGETLGFSMNTKPAENMKKGLVALFVKGFIWFGIFGIFMGIYLTASAGSLYIAKDFYILLALIPPFGIVGYVLLNKPLDVKKGKFPKIFFSKTRQESWGGLLGILLLLVIFTIVKGDKFALKLMCGSSLSGAFGWVIAQTLQVLTKYPMKNGKYFFKRLQERKMLDTWKIMECTIGLLTGIGISVTLCILKDDLAAITTTIDANMGLWNPIGELAKPLTIVWLVVVALDMVQHLLKKPDSKDTLDKLLNDGTITRNYYDKKLKKVGAGFSDKFYKIYGAVAEAFTFPIYSVVPLFMVMLGSVETAKYVSFFILYLVIAQKVAFERVKYFKNRLSIRILLLGGALAVLIAMLGFDWSPGIIATVIMHGIVYELATLIFVFHRPRLKKEKGKGVNRNKNKKAIKDAQKRSLAAVYGSSIPTHIYFGVCIVITTVFTILYLK